MQLRIAGGVMTDMPHSINGERSLIGGLILSPDTIPDVEAMLTVSDFYRPDHGRLFRLLCDMHSRREQIDMVSVVERVARGRHSEAYGGVRYVAELSDDVPSTLNLLHYADIVVRKSKYRNAIQVMDLGRESALDEGDEPEDIIDRVITDLGDTRGIGVRESAPTTIFDAVDDVLGEKSEQAESGDTPCVISNLSALDGWMVLRRQTMVILAARPSMGKAQPLDEPVLTPTGFVEMGSLSVGDEVVGCDGEPHRVLAVRPQGVRAIYRVIMSDGSWSRSCGEHMWQTRTRSERRRNAGFSPKSLDSISETLLGGGKWAGNHEIPVCEAVNVPGQAKIPRYIKEVTEAGVAECQCIEVEGGLYVTRDFIVTHNSALAINAALNVALAGEVAGVIQIEMDTRMVVDRVLAQYTGMPMTLVQDPASWSQRDWKEVMAAKKTLREVPFLLWTPRRPTAAQVRSTALRWQMQRGRVSLLVVDYLTKMKHQGDRHEGISKNAEAMKELAKELDTCVMLLHAVNRRAGSDAKNPVPSLDQLKDSGDLEYHADGVVFIHRPAYYDSGEPNWRAQVIVSKNRQGQCGTSELEWWGSQQLFRDSQGESPSMPHGLIRTAKNNHNTESRDDQLDVGTVGGERDSEQDSSAQEAWSGRQPGLGI